MGIRLISKEQKELVLENKGLVHFVIKRLGVGYNFGDYEDIFSEGMIGLIKAIITFDEKKGFEFATYAMICIRNEIYMYFRHANRHMKNISLEETIDINDSERTLSDIIPTDYDLEKEVENEHLVIEYMNIILNCLKLQERLVMLYTIAGEKQTIIAKKFNISRSGVSRIQTRARKKVKIYFEKEVKYEEVCSMSIKNNLYQISFLIKDIENFNSFFAHILEMQKKIAVLKVGRNQKRILLQMPAYTESFYIIAQVIEDCIIKCSVGKKANSKNNQIKNYIFSKEYFTCKELINQFKDVNEKTIRKYINDLIKEGLIKDSLKKCGTFKIYEVIKN